MGELKVLLDTHIFLWWLFDDKRLSKKNRELILNMENLIYISAASVWEISTKYRLGKLDKAASIANDVPRWIQKAGFIPLSITDKHAQLAGNWDIPHRDPFDRMLAAQARIEQLTLMSDDKMMTCFPIKLAGG